MRGLVIALILALLTGCTPEKKLQRAHRKVEKLTIRFPQLLQKDTLIDTVKVITPTVTTDTLFHRDTDTVIVNNERLKIQYIKVGDTIKLMGECKGDTVYQRVEIPVERIVVQKQSLLDKLKKGINWLLVIAFLLLLLYVAYKVVVRFIKPL
jgi:hypothetical protein